MSEPQQYSKQAVFMARALFVVAGAVVIGLGAYAEAILPPAIRVLGFGLEVLGAIVLGFGAFARGNVCATVSHRLLNFLRR